MNDDCFYDERLKLRKPCFSLTEGKTKTQVKQQDTNAPSPTTPPPPAGKRSPAGHYMTDAKASQLAERGFKLEGYIMRDEIGDVALIHCGRVVWLTPDEMESILRPNSNLKVRYSDEEN